MFCRPDDFNAARNGGWRLDLDDDEDAIEAIEELAEGYASDDPEVVDDDGCGSMSDDDESVD